MLYKIYVLYAINYDKIFVGLTSSLTERMAVHNGDETEDWTTAFKPWTLIHMELFNSEDAALKREQYLETSHGNAFIREEILPLFNFN